MVRPGIKRVCQSCSCKRQRAGYIPEQWAKTSTHQRYCMGCEANGDNAAAASTLAPGRENEDAYLCLLDEDQLEHPFAQGKFRWVASSTYDDGHELAGKKSVAKWVKTGATLDATFYTKDLKAVDKAVESVEAFNQEQIANGIIRVNTPELWEFSTNCGHEYAGMKHLVERYIYNYQRFNSNTGWTRTTVRWGDIMLALSHFTYHKTDRQLMLVVVQGGVFPGGAILTDPVTLSSTRSYGVTDLGPNGISNFFSNHPCTDFCLRTWKVHPNSVRYSGDHDGGSAPSGGGVSGAGGGSGAGTGADSVTASAIAVTLAVSADATATAAAARAVEDAVAAVVAVYGSSDSATGRGAGLWR